MVCHHGVCLSSYTHTKPDAKPSVEGGWAACASVSGRSASSAMDVPVQLLCAAAGSTELSS
jgi:hypothetical protein